MVFAVLLSSLLLLEGTTMLDISRVLGGEMVTLPPCPSPGCFPEFGFSDGMVVLALDDELVPTSVQMLTCHSWVTELEG